MHKVAEATAFPKGADARAFPKVEMPHHYQRAGDLGVPNGAKAARFPKGLRAGRF